MRSPRSRLFAATLLPAVVLVSACSDSPRPYGDRTTPPPSSKDGAGVAPAPPAPTTPPGVPQDRNESKK